MTTVQELAGAAASTAVETRTVDPVLRRRGLRIDWVLLAILLTALLLRLHLASAEQYIHDEANTWIPLSRTISFTPGHVNLPLRAENHGALPGYVVKASSTLFGTTRLGYRLAHVILALCTIGLVFAAGWQWYGPVAARWAAALWAFNEYYLAISARATAQVPTLFFDALAVYAFSRFLSTQRAAYLFGAGASVGLAFYCKENSALLLPVFFVALLTAKYRHWLRRPQPYLAAAVFLLIIAPDAVWNMTINRETARTAYGTQPVGYATYRSHLARIGGLGFSAYPSMFYAREPVTALYRRATGTALTNETPEYLSVNPVLGALLVGAVLITTFARRMRDDMQRFLLLLFWGVFGLFTLIARGDPPGRLDPVSWIWVEVTLLPAVILTGARLAAARGIWRVGAWTLAGAVLVYATVSVLSS